MDLREYYGFPDGANVTLRYASFYDLVDDNFPCPNNMSYAFAYESRSCIKKLNTTNVTNMSNMFYSCKNFIEVDLSGWDTSKVTDMNNMFNGCSMMTSIDISSWDTSNVTTMDRMVYQCSKLETIGYMNCISVQKDKYPIYMYSANSTLKNLGGFYMRNSWVAKQGLTNCSGLTVESLVNVLNALYDFTGNGETPTSNEGKLALGATHLAKLTDEQKAIATNKGWTLS